MGPPIPSFSTHYQLHSKLLLIVLPYPFQYLSKLVKLVKLYQILTSHSSLYIFPFASQYKEFHDLRQSSILVLQLVLG